MEFIRRKPETTDSAAALIFRLGDPHLLDGADDAVAEEGHVEEAEKHEAREADKADLQHGSHEARQHVRSVIYIQKTRKRNHVLVNKWVTHTFLTVPKTLLSLPKAGGWEGVNVEDAESKECPSLM